MLPDQRGRDISFAENRKEIERIRREEPDLFDRGGTTRGAISGEEYRQELRQAIEQGLLDEIRSLPWGSGSGMAARPGTVGTTTRPGTADLPGYAGTVGTTTRLGTADLPGYVFCARVADSERVAFRYVQLNHGGDAVNEPTVIDDTLDCLRRAQPPAGPGTPRQLDDDTHERAFHAWETARADILLRWNFLADKANLEPASRQRSRKPRRYSAVTLPPGSPRTNSTVRSTVSVLRTQNAPCAPSAAAMASTENPTEQADKILGAVKALGLEPHIPPAALPEITPDDIHLVCWLALT